MNPWMTGLSRLAEDPFAVGTVGEDLRVVQVDGHAMLRCSAGRPIHYTVGSARASWMSLRRYDALRVAPLGPATDPR